ncbi:MAG: orotidine 5'-phosphate decarboxylase [Candidatus Liptonbacteria bacterium GWB1_49_6]|uniref:Orotidine-5'-phosphate decarboxylase n=1 Tax=Candidatus Liptonbacteria bacterium GWB1_49_6 TaxID=1798644 RepID=A0A1G2C8J7_9BACT|nr:MAG: orotidine 5'-phosphate decarboxylase [Candidatus Liptonbacteria bacterium GWB1_49_6]
MRNFRELLKAQWEKGNFVCVGLDSEYEKIPDVVRHNDITTAITHFNRDIVEATKDIVCAYKANFAFYAAHVTQGLSALKDTMDWIRDLAPNVPMILDIKVDIENTNNGYAKMAFDSLEVDAITVNPYLGGKALHPFFNRKGKGVIVLCKTSNSGAGEFQDLLIAMDDPSRVGAEHAYFGQKIPLYQYVAYHARGEWNANGNCGVVMGATCPPKELKRVREIVGDIPILFTGVGFQQKDIPLEEQVKRVVENGKNSLGQGMIVNSSRGIIFASKGADFAEAARRETIKLRDLINQYR